MLNFFRNLNWAKVAQIVLVLVLLVGIMIPNLKSIDRDGMLLQESYRGNILMVRILVALGADVNYKYNFGNTTPLHEAAYSGNTNVVKFLISNGADVNAMDDAGRTPWHLTAREEIKALLPADPDPLMHRQNGDTLLHDAAAYGDLQKMQWLLENGADINANGYNGETPLIAACENTQFYAVKFLVENGADVNVQDKSLGNALHSAIFQAHLSQRNAEQTEGITKQGYQQEYQKRKRIVGMLLNAGAQPTTTHVYLCQSFGITGELPNMLYRYARDTETINWMEREDIWNYLKLQKISR